MRWVARYFARAVVRRVAYLAVAGLLGLVLHMCAAGEARADDCPAGNNVCDQGVAYAACKAAVERTKAFFTANPTGYTLEVRKDCVYSAGPTESLYSCVVSAGSTRCMNSDGTLDGQSFYFKSAQSCGARNATKLADAGLSYSAPSTCVGGCQVQGTPFSSETGGVKIYGMKDRTYNAQVCVPAKPTNNISQVNADKDDATKPKGQECTALDAGQTACHKTNGEYCATASTGKTFCWSPSQTGKQTDGTDAQVKSPKGEPVTPPSTTISDQEWQRKEGHQQTACVNTTCTTYNVTNYASVPAGTSKNSTGDNTATGSGNTSGNGTPGKGTKDGDDDGDGDSASDSGNCTTPPACTGDTLKCLHLKFTWKNQCNTTHNEVTKGDGCDAGDVPVCAGSSCKAEAYSLLLQQWRARCDGEAIRKGVEGQAGQGDGDDGQGSILIHDGGQGASLNEGLVTYGAGTLGYDFDVEGISFKMPQQLLDFLPILRMLIIAAASLAAIGIMRGNG